MPAALITTEKYASWKLLSIQTGILFFSYSFLYQQHVNDFINIILLPDRYRI